MKKQFVAIALSAIGIIYFLTVAFDLLPGNVGTFAGVVFIFMAGLAWAFWPKK
jgi:hypothetical protein